MKAAERPAEPGKETGRGVDGEEIEGDDAAAMEGPQGEEGGDDEELANVEVEDEVVGGEGLASEGPRAAGLNKGDHGAGGRDAFEPVDIGDDVHQSLILAQAGRGRAD